MQVSSEILKRYLIRGLGNAEMEDIDVRIISGEMSAEQLAFAEQELIEDYLEDNLSAGDKARFRENYLTSDERREQLDEISLLKRYARDEAQDVTAVSKPRQSIFSGFVQNFRPLTAAVAVLAIGLIAFAGWRILLSPSPSPLESEYAILNQQDLSADGGKYSIVQIAPGTMRDTIAGAKIASANFTESVLFRLSLPFKSAGDSLYQAEVLKDGVVVFTIERGRIYPSGAGNEARVLIPRTVLTKGLHEIRLTDGGNADSAVIYSFTVE